MVSEFLSFNPSEQSLDAAKVSEKKAPSGRARRIFAVSLALSSFLALAGRSAEAAKQPNSIKESLAFRRGVEIFLAARYGEQINGPQTKITEGKETRQIVVPALGEKVLVSVKNGARWSELQNYDCYTDTQETVRKANAQIEAISQGKPDLRDRLKGIIRSTVEKFWGRAGVSDAEREADAKRISDSIAGMTGNDLIKQSVEVANSVRQLTGKTTEAGELAVCNQRIILNAAINEAQKTTDKINNNPAAPEDIIIIPAPTAEK